MSHRGVGYMAACVQNHLHDGTLMDFLHGPLLLYGFPAAWVTRLTCMARARADLSGVEASTGWPVVVIIRAVREDPASSSVTVAA